MSTAPSATATEDARRFLDFVNASPSPFHAVAQAADLLDQAGFKRLSERAEWSNLEPNGSYYIVRNQTSLVSFVVGGQYVPGNGFNMIGAHTDSPCLKLKPNSKVQKHGFLEVGVQTYGGGIWHTWFDRDLQVAGRVIVQTSEDSYVEKLVRINRPLLRIPTLAIHLQRDVNDAFKFNTETQLLPIIATALKDQLVRKDAIATAAAEVVAAATATTSSTTSSSYPQSSHHPVLLELIAREADCRVDQIKDLELCLAEFQPAGFGGAYDEFIFSPRLDNLLSSYCSIEALRSVASDREALAKESNILVAALFDNEEVGSESVNGAGSNILEHILKRIFLAFCPGEPRDLYELAVRKSFLVSADMAHACHPNYADKHEDRHAPAIHAGVVVKNNANQRYATSSVSGFFVRELARRNSIPIQEFVVRNDSLCGSTIGPMLSARGFRTVDIGAPQLSMHSAREMMGTDDVSHTLALFKAFYQQFTKLDASVSIDC